MPTRPQLELAPAAARAPASRFSLARCYRDQERASMAAAGFYLRVYACAAVLEHLWDQYLRSRTRARLRRSGVPPAVKAALPDVDEEAYERAREYSRDKNALGTVTDFLSLLIGFATLWLAPRVWNGPALRAIERLGLAADHEVCRMVASMLILAPWSLCTTLPFSAWRTFVTEERYKFNKHTWRSWLSDALKSFVIEELVLNILLLGPMTLILRRLGPGAWWWLWLFTSAFILAFNMAYPVLIAPLFNTFKALDDGPVRQGIEGLIRSSGISCSCVFEVDGSRQSSHSNAYVAGFFKTKRIVVYDTLITHLDGQVDDVCAVVAHEIGHSKLQHNYALLGVACAQIFVLFYTLGFFTSDPSLVTDFGYDASCTYLTLAMFMMCYTAVVQPAFSVLFNAVTRQLEFAADAYSHRLGYDIRAALAKISKTNLADLNPDPLVSMCRDSHPTTVQRVAAIEALRKAAAGGGAEGREPHGKVD